MRCLNGGLQKVTGTMSEEEVPSTKMVTLPSRRFEVTTSGRSVANTLGNGEYGGVFNELFYHSAIQSNIPSISILLKRSVTSSTKARSAIPSM